MALTKKTDHAAFVTGDTAATLDFYTRVLQLPLVNAITGLEPDGRRFFISAFQADGFLLEFEEVEDRPGPRPQAAGFPHFGLDVGSAADYEQWKEHLDECGAAYLETSEHNCWVSDPNGLSFQLIVRKPAESSEDDRAELARQMVDDWIKSRAQS